MLRNRLKAMATTSEPASDGNLPLDFGDAAPAAAFDDLPADARALAEKPRRVITDGFDMRIDANGTWFHDGARIGRKRLVKLFAGVLRRDDAGGYWLVTPVEMARVTVEDAPFTAVEVSAEGTGADQTIRFRTNVDDVVRLDDEHSLRVETDGETGEPRPYVTVRDRIEARIVRSAFYQLVDLACEQTIDGAPVLGVWSAGCFFPLGSTDAPEGAGNAA